MQSYHIFLLLLGIGVTGFFVGRQRSLKTADGDIRQLHSLPKYYGLYVLAWSILPAFMVMIVWLSFQPGMIATRIADGIPQSAITEKQTRQTIAHDALKLSHALNHAMTAGDMTKEQADNFAADNPELKSLLKKAGVSLTGAPTPELVAAAKQYRNLNHTATTAMAFVVIILAISGFFYTWTRINRNFRARNSVETLILYLLIAAALVAILTTIGIVASLFFNTVKFFHIYPASRFFFSTKWNPSFGGDSDLGILPLLWGTLYISLIALLVAVPTGLMAAVYLSEYASKFTRSVAKPLIEVLAGIPSIVYGMFALLTVGPLLLDIFGADGFGWMQAGTAVITAGLVMGIRLIPFVSSLSDDIINAVPQNLRDGSYALGSTRSETIRQVILPAALPGIVGAVLLAASRAIGETMIVVMGAGAAARISLNPFEAMTTVTVKIVSQLTGDADFASPEALVAFALGMTLFVMTLGLNVVALYIVRKYREQYE